ncbi:MAG TPA: electron transfer flavoprotein subunit beta/FixA family protein [Aquella sp.]|nr:electron transfer flavoprotein subunit beta/FixA family protein [Aquella sp.]
MKIMVCAKRVVDANIKVRVKPDGSNVDIEHSKMSLNPFDENAIEEAVRIKEAGKASEIFAVSIGNEKCTDTLRTALARGCDRAILVSTTASLEPIHVAKTLKQIVLREKPDLILIGKQAIDDDANQVGQMLAAMLDYPQATFISKLELNDNKIIACRELDNGTESLEITLPTVVTADLHLNEPRFVKLPQLMMAKKKTIEHIELADLGISTKPSTRLIKAIDGEIKKNCVMLDDCTQILKILNEVT